MPAALSIVTRLRNCMMSSIAGIPSLIRLHFGRKEAHQRNGDDGEVLLGHVALADAVADHACGCEECHST